MKKLLFSIILASLFALFFPVSVIADDGKVCPVKGGSVQADVTNSTTPKYIGNGWEYDVTFVLMNSSPNYVNATYVVKDAEGNTCSKARVLFAPHKQSESIVVKVKTKSNKSTFVVDVIGADCKII